MSVDDPTSASVSGRRTEERALRPPSVATVGLVVLAGVLLTSFHYTDNYVSIETYPQPDWITGAVILVGWPVLTAFGVGGYLLYRSGRFAAAQACLLVYSYTGLSSLGHYLYGSLSEFSAKQHVLILSDGVTGVAVLAFVVWSILLRGNRIRQPSERTT